MGAIIGRVNFDATPIRKKDFLSAYETSRYYGPDGSGHNLDYQVGLGQHCCKIGRSRQTYSKPIKIGTLSVVADALLDNRDELFQATCCNQGANDKTVSDAELIARVLAKHSVGGLNLLEGDYALALWDHATKKLTLATDHVGSRPLYWRRQGNALVFGTDVRSLCEFSDFQWEIDRLAVERYLYSPLATHDGCFFKGLNLCKQGSWAVFSQNGSEFGQWWAPHCEPKKMGLSPAETIDGLRFLTERSIRAAVDTDRSVGGHFSGGLDSSYISVFGNRTLGERGKSLRCYSWSPKVSEEFPDLGPNDERRRILSLAEKEGLSVSWGETTGEALLQVALGPMEFEGTADLVDELAVAKKAKNDGIGVMLSGWGGDDAFSAYGQGYHAQLFKRLEFAKLWSSVSGGRRTKIKKLSAFVLPLVVPYWEQLSELRHGPTIDANKWISDKHSKQSRFRVFDKKPANPNQYILKQLLAGHLSVRMRSWSVLGAGSGFQYRYPLLNKKLVEYIVNMPNEIFMFDRNFRYPARAVLADLGISDPRKLDPVNEHQRNVALRNMINMISQSNLPTTFLKDEQLLNSLQNSFKDHDRYRFEAYSVFAAIRGARLLDIEASRTDQLWK